MIQPLIGKWHHGFVNGRLELFLVVLGSVGLLTDVIDTLDCITTRNEAVARFLMNINGSTGGVLSPEISEILDTTITMWNLGQ